MKTLIGSLTLLFSTQLLAQDLYLSNYNFTVPDIARRGLTKETMFSSMERTFLKLNSSICSNRALVWAHNFKRQYGVDTAKLFLFYSDKTGEVGDKKWWYHVTPLVNERGTLYALDAGFPGFVKTPLLPEQWLQKFVGSTNCKEIRNEDEDLIALMFTQSRFPSTTRYGTYDCYYRITSGPYWTPNTVAQNLLQRDRRGRPISFYRDSIVQSELLQSCKEASTTPVGGIFSNSDKKCREYLGLPLDN